MDEARLAGRLGYLQAPPVRRVAVISLHTSPTASLGHSANGGMNVYVNEVCAALGERGVDTDVFTRLQSPGDRKCEPLGPTSRVIYVPAGKGQMTKYELISSVDRFAAGVLEFVEADAVEYDLIYSHYWLSGAAGLILRRRLELPLVHIAHTLGRVKNRQLAPGATPEPELRILVERSIAQEADLLVASTAAEREDLVREYGAAPERVAVVAPGVDLATFERVDKAQAKRLIGVAADEQLLVFAGRLERLKGVEIALRAVAEIAGAYPRLRLMVLGDDSGSEPGEHRRLVRLARALRVDNQVTFAGSIPHDRVSLYYSAAEACLMPSYSESFGLVGLEAQACGCAVIAADVAGLASVVRDQVTGFLVGSDDPREYASRIERLLADPQLAAQMGRRGSLLAQRFSWSRTADRLLGEFQKLTLAAPQLRLQTGATLE